MYVMLIWNRLAHFANALQSTVNSIKSRDFSTFGSLQFFNLMFSLWSVRPSSEHTPLTMEFVRFVSLSVHSWMLVLWWRSATLYESVKPHRNKCKMSSLSGVIIEKHPQWAGFWFDLISVFALWFSLLSIVRHIFNYSTWRFDYSSPAS